MRDLPAKPLVRVLVVDDEPVTPDELDATLRAALKEVRP